jgi:hypothetical protein
VLLFFSEVISRGFPGGLTRSLGTPGPDKNPAAAGLAKTSIMIIIILRGRNGFDVNREL